MLQTTDLSSLNPLEHYFKLTVFLQTKLLCCCSNKITVTARHLFHISTHPFAGRAGYRNNNTLPTNPRMPFYYFSYGLPPQGGGPGTQGGGPGGITGGGPGTQGGLNGLRIVGLYGIIIGPRVETGTGLVSITRGGDSVTGGLAMPAIGALSSTFK